MSLQIKMIKLNKPACPNTKALQSNYKHPANKAALRNASSGKCIYCESKIDDVYFGDVEHIKPKSVHPELTYDWDNLGYICAKCNSAKLDKYDATCEVVNPYGDDPADYIFAANATLFCVQGSERGEKTILDVDLNRNELLENRRLKIIDVDTAVKSCFRTKNTALRDAALEELKKQALPDKEYSACIASFLTSQKLL